MQICGQQLRELFVERGNTFLQGLDLGSGLRESEFWRGHRRTESECSLDLQAGLQHL